MLEPILVIPLEKAWSEEARAAAIAARQAKSAGKDPREAKMRARELVRGGASPSEAASKAVADSGNAGSPNTLAVDIADVTRPDNSFASGSAEERDYAQSESDRLTEGAAKAVADTGNASTDAGSDGGTGLEATHSPEVLKELGARGFTQGKGSYQDVVNYSDGTEPGGRSTSLDHPELGKLSLFEQKSGKVFLSDASQAMGQGMSFASALKDLKAVQREWVRDSARMDKLSARDKEREEKMTDKQRSARDRREYIESGGPARDLDEMTVNKSIHLVLPISNDEPILVMPLQKAWSDEARAAAIAARQAKSAGKDPKEAGARAKELVGKGMNPKEAAAQAVKDVGDRAPDADAMVERFDQIDPRMLSGTDREDYDRIDQLIEDGKFGDEHEAEVQRLRDASAATLKERNEVSKEMRAGLDDPSDIAAEARAQSAESVVTSSESFPGNERNPGDYAETFDRHGISHEDYAGPLSAQLLGVMDSHYEDAMGGADLPAAKDQGAQDRVEATLVVAGLRSGEGDDGYAGANLHLVSEYDGAKLGVDSLTGEIFDVLNGKQIGKMKDDGDVASLKTAAELLGFGKNGQEAARKSIDPRLVMPLEKAWSEEARAAAIAARQAKSAGKDPKEAGARAKELVAGGMNPKEAADKAVADTGDADTRTIPDWEPDPNMVRTEIANDDVAEAFDASTEEPAAELRSFDGMNSLKGMPEPDEFGSVYGRDVMHIPSSSAEVKGNTLKITSDHGDESMYGDEVWEKQGSDMVLLRNWGRDTHEENLADSLGTTLGGKVPMDKFKEGLGNHMKYWNERTLETVAEAKATADEDE